ncbi:MAG: metallophosphatase [Prevotella sp.]|nr:metallophosphatase [Prevotella sp.]
MKKVSLIITLVLTVALSSMAKGGRQLVILHTNDTHSCIFPLSEALADTMLAGRGGFIRRIAMLKEERQKNPDLLYFDSGDFSQGSSYYTLYKGDVEIGLMNEMGIDASTIGNHEFDFGMENMARIFRMANFPIVCSNYDFTGTVVEGLVKPYIVLKRKGIKIGVFALCPKMEGLVDLQKCQGVKYLDPAQVANEMGDLLKNKLKCDLVICISHLGWAVKGHDDNYMIENSRNVDLVLGGHSHTYLPTLEYVNNLDGKPIPVDQNGKHAIYVGKLVLDMKKK